MRSSHTHNTTPIPHTHTHTHTHPCAGTCTVVALPATYTDWIFAKSTLSSNRSLFLSLNDIQAVWKMMAYANHTVHVCVCVCVCVCMCLRKHETNRHVPSHLRFYDACACGEFVVVCVHFCVCVSMCVCLCVLQCSFG